MFYYQTILGQNVYIVIAMIQNFFNEISSYRSGIMGLSIISIMLFHQYFVKSPVLNIFHNYGYWGVDVFLFLSGMGLVCSLESHSLFVFYKRRFWRIMPACFLCGTIKYIVFLLMGTSVVIIKNGLHIGWWSVMSLDLWYINTIILFYILSPILYKLLKYYPVIIIMCILFSFFICGLTIREQVGYEWMSVVGIIAWSIERLPVFILGMFLSMHKNMPHNKMMIISYISLLVAVFIIAGRKYIWGELVGQNMILTLALVLGMIALVKINILLLKKIPLFVRNIISFWGTLSLELYLVHEFVFCVFLVRFHINPYLQLFVSVALSLLIAFLCKLTITEIKNYVHKTRNVDV